MLQILVTMKAPCRHETSHLYSHWYPWMATSYTSRGNPSSATAATVLRYHFETFLSNTEKENHIVI